MTDERMIELGEAHQATLTNAQITNIRSKVPVPGTAVPEECDCGETIPDGRRALGYSTCLYCASKRNGR